MNQNETKVIPRDVWVKLKEYWDNTLYKDLKEKEIKQILGKYVLIPIPKDITNKTEARIWYIRMADLREKGVPFGNYHWTIDEEGLKTTLGEILDMKEAGDIVPTTLTKKLYEWAKTKGYAPEKKE